MHGYVPEKEDIADLLKCTEFIKELVSEVFKACPTSLFYDNGRLHPEDLDDFPCVLSFIEQRCKEFGVKIAYLVRKMLVSIVTDYFLLYTPLDIDRSKNTPLPFIPDVGWLFVSAPLMMDYFMSGEENLKMYFGSKFRDAFIDAGNTIHFVHKRIPCKCLVEYDKNCRLNYTGSALCYNTECSRHYQPVRKKEVRVCMKCHFTQYCSEACQKQDYAHHKSICEEVSDDG
jgi:hypothetical protein